MSSPLPAALGSLHLRGYLDPLYGYTSVWGRGRGGFAEPSSLGVARCS